MPSISCPAIATTDFAYVRFHGSSGLYCSCYSDEELAKWAKRQNGLGRNLKAVYIYFNNDAEAFAVRNAANATLKEIGQAESHTKAPGNTIPKALYPNPILFNCRTIPKA